MTASNDNQGSASRVLARPVDIAVPADKPFKNDKLGREKCADVLTGLVSNTLGPLVISISGKWGTGKTVFLRMWRQQLQNMGFSTILFNAWQDDYFDDALVALLGQLSLEVKSTIAPGKGSEVEDQLEKVISKSGRFFKRTVPLWGSKALKALTNLDGNDVADIITDAKGYASEFPIAAIKDYERTRKNLSEFKEELTRFAKLVTNPQNTGDNSKGTCKPFVIIIDELDRCRPLFAIELLEKAKHLFDIPGLVFVLGVDRDQLGNSIKSVYGQNMEVGGYLSRLIDLNFTLPPTDSDVYCRHLFDQYGLREFFAKRNTSQYRHQYEYKNLIETFVRLFTLFNLSLRDQEHCIRQLMVVTYSLLEAQTSIPMLLATLIVLRHVNHELYYRFAGGDCTSEEVLEYFLDQQGGMDFYVSYEGIIVEAHLLLVSPRLWQEKITSQLSLLCEKKALTMKDVPQRIKEMGRDRLERLIEIIKYVQKEDFRHGLSYTALKYLTEKIELASLMVKAE